MASVRKLQNNERQERAKLRKAELSTFPWNDSSTSLQGLEDELEEFDFWGREKPKNKPKVWPKTSSKQKPIGPAWSMELTPLKKEWVHKVVSKKSFFGKGFRYGDYFVAPDRKALDVFQWKVSLAFAACEVLQEPNLLITPQAFIEDLRWYAHSVTKYLRDWNGRFTGFQRKLANQLFYALRKASNYVAR